MNFIDIHTASKRSGLTPRQIRRLCNEVYLSRGKAKLINTTGRPVWQVAETADPRFNRVRLPHHITANMREFREKDRDLAFKRLEILQLWESVITNKLNSGRSKVEATDEFLTEFSDSLPIARVSRPTLYRWEKSFRREGIKGLLPRRVEVPEASISDDAIREFRKLYLDLRQPSVKSCYQQVCYLAGQNGWSWFNSLRACQRWVARSFTKPELILNREGKQAYDAVCAPYLQRDPEQFSGNECWVGDHHQMDLWCMYKDKLIRPWLTAWQDMRSRVITGWTLCPLPNQSTILLAFRSGCREFSPPAHVYMDNGKDYDSFTFTGTTKSQRKKALRKGYIDEGVVKGLFGQLGISVTFAIPYNPQSKPIERTFRTFEDQFCRTFTTYCGNSPFARPENLQDILNSGKGIPEFEDIEKKFNQYLEEVYHTAPHSGAGMENRSPIQVLRETQIIKRVADDRVLDLMLRIWSQPVTVGKHGIRFKNINYGSMQPEIISLQGRKVRIAYDPKDIAEVTVWDLDGKYICRAGAARLISGMTDEHLREAMRTKRQISRSLREADAHRGNAHRDISELAIAAAARDADIPEGAEPAVLRPIKTDLDAALMQLAKPLKQAVGAEFGISDQDIFDNLTDDDSDSMESETININERLLKLADD